MRWFYKLGLAAALLVGVQSAANAQFYIDPAYRLPGNVVQVTPTPITVLYPDTVQTRVLTHSAVVAPTVLGGSVVRVEPSWRLNAHPYDVSPFGLFHPNNWFGRMFGYMSE